MPIRRPLAALLVALSTTGCLHRSHDVADAFTWNDALPAGATLHLRDLNGAIRIRPASDARAAVHASKHWRRGHEKDVHFVAQRAGSDVYVCALWGSATRCDASGYGTTRTSLFRRFLRLFAFGSTSTDMRVDFDIAVPAGVRVDASTVNGDVDATGSGASVRVSTVNGSVHAGGGSPLVARSVNGSVTVSLDALGAADTVSAESVNGNVIATVPADFQGSVRLATVNGSVGSDLPVTTSGTLGRHQLDGTIGNAPRSLELQTVNGRAHIRKRG